MKKFLLLTFLGIISQSLFSQRTIIELTFTAIDNASWIQLDSIKVMNRTQGADTVLYWPDTALLIYQTDIPESSGEKNGFQIFPNYPNPAKEQTAISLYIPDKDNVCLIVTDMLGRIIIKSEMLLNKGKHTFRFIPGIGNLYFFTAIWHGQSSSIKVLNSGFQSGETTYLEYTGSEDFLPQLKEMNDLQNFFFNPGDELLYIGYVDTLQSGILDAPEESQSYTFQFSTNTPCPGTPIVEYEGQAYNTIQIFSQCWLKENLNVGEMINGPFEQSDNGIIEKYCYYNQPDSCTKYGGLYQWNEMMQYTIQPGAQGICPPGWHVPTDEEWKVLEGAVDSQHRVGDYIWEYTGWRGTDAGTNLKSTSDWYGNGNGIDLFGFSGMPGGFRHNNGDFANVGDFGYWLTSTEYSIITAWAHDIYYTRSDVYRSYQRKDYGHSVRCIMDY